MPKEWTLVEIRPLKYVMQNEYMWEKQGKNGACRKCGQFIKRDEAYYLIVVSGIR